jgi:hypothetical protein
LGDPSDGVSDLAPGQPVIAKISSGHRCRP